MPNMINHHGSLFQKLLIFGSTSIPHLHYSTSKVRYEPFRIFNFFKKKKPQEEKKEDEKEDKKEDCPPPEQGMSLVDKNVAYVGGFGAIGYLCCRQLICEGIKQLVILDLHENKCLIDELHKMALNFPVHSIRLDLTKDRSNIEYSIKRAHKRMGHIDVLINGSAIINERNPRLSIQTNLMGLMETTFAAIKCMSRDEGGKGGLIVNVASVFGLEPGAFVAVYSATKHGVVGFTRAMAHKHNYEVTGIAHIAVCPGFTDTNLMRDLKDRSTFRYSKPIADEYLFVKKQNANDCARGMILAMTQRINGSIWIIDENKLKRVEVEEYWSCIRDVCE